MTVPGPLYGPNLPHSQVESGSWPEPQFDPSIEMARIVLRSAQDAAEAILAAAERTAKAITDAAQAVPVALATPPPQGVSPEDLALAIERATGMGNNYVDYGGPGIPYDHNLDQLVDEYGNSIAPNWSAPGVEVGVEVPDPQRDTSGTIKPGTPLVDGIPRLDL